jgi:hypothetical protein
VIKKKVRGNERREKDRGKEGEGGRRRVEGDRDRGGRDVGR